MAEMLYFILQCFYFMLPAYFSNMSPVFMKKSFNFMSIPIDFNNRINNKPILGKNKTFRGIFFALFFGILIAFIQFYIYKFEFFRKLSFFDYSNWLLFGFLMGFGAIFGDTVKSFFKRRLNIKPGHKFIPFDQIDFVFGSLIFVSPIISITANVFFTALILSFILHIIVNHIAYYLGIRNEKW